MACKDTALGISYIILRGRWYDIALSTHAPTEDKVMTPNASFYEDGKPKSIHKAWNGNCQRDEISCVKKHYC
jgi:hypothetical protein